MLKRIGIALFMFLCILSVSAATVQAEDDIIENSADGMPDAVLYKKILDILGKHNGDKFTRQEAESIKKISLQYDEKVQTFQGIEYCKNLTDLKALEISTENLEEIALKVPNLERLSVCGNRRYFLENNSEESRRQIDSLKALENMKCLVSLDVSYNYLVSFEGIEGLENLENFLAKGNQVSDAGELERLAKLGKLKQLDLSENQLKEIKGSGQLENLKILYLRDNILEDLGEMSKLKNLIALDINGNRIKKIDGIRNLVNLKYLWAEENCLTNISAVKYMKNLTELSVRGNMIKSFPTLKALKKLEYLDASDNELQSCPKIKKNKKLKKVSLSWNHLKKKDIKNSIPKKFWKEDKKIGPLWKSQKEILNFKFITPKNKSQITKNTNKIAGRASLKESVESAVFCTMLPEEKVNKRYCDKESVHDMSYGKKKRKLKVTLSQLDLKEYAGKEVELKVFINERSNSNMFTVDRFVVKE